MNNRDFALASNVYFKFTSDSEVGARRSQDQLRNPELLKDKYHVSVTRQAIQKFFKVRV